MFSSAMIGNALPASHLYMMTSLRPAMKQLSITGTQPVTWKRGTIRMNDGGNGSAGASGSSDANFNTALRAENAMSALRTARCVDTAPFGRPVVPDVYKIVASSSSEMSATNGPSPVFTTAAQSSTSAPSSRSGRTHNILMPCLRHEA